MSTTMEIRKYTVDFSAQVKDGLMTQDDLQSFLKSTMKVNNCVKIAQKEIQFNGTDSILEISAKSGKIRKRDMKLYLKRYLRRKSLKDFVKVSGDKQDGFSLVYINEVDETE